MAMARPSSHSEHPRLRKIRKFFTNIRMGVGVVGLAFLSPFARRRLEENEAAKRKPGRKN